MKRSKHIQLILLSAIPFALTACGDDPQSVEQAVRTVTDQRTFESVQSCVDSKLPADICADAFMSALALHRKQAPLYDTQTNCEADFIAGYCAPITGGQFMPKLGGFQITSEREEPIQPAGSAGSGHSGGGDGLLTGLLLGQMMSSGGARYYSEPIYRGRDSRGAYNSSTLAKQIELGNKFGRSQQAIKGGGYALASGKSSTVNSALGRKTTVVGAKPASMNAPAARGGFGAQASARSGWGGLSSLGG